MPGPAWWDQALCFADPDLFTADDYRGELLEEARGICDRCPVKATCLETALAEEGTTAANMRGSIRGGKTPAERWALGRRQRQQQAA